jgi:anti-sigma regulatory factor (Ser/Thr protein kinase)
MRLAVGPGTAGEARAAIREALPTVAPSVVSDAELLTSELVTNAVRHGGLGPADTIGLRIGLTSEHLRVGVLDTGPGFDKGVRPRDTDGGWGLVLVETVSDRWGVIKNRPNEVWFEIDV